MKRIFASAVAAAALTPAWAFAGTIGTVCNNPAGDILDLTTAGASGTINGGRFQQVQPQSTGTGVIDPFLRLQNDGCQQGFNTSTNPDPLDNKGGIWTHDLKLADTGTTLIGGIEYYQFLLDINQVNSGDNKYLSLDQLRIYQSNTASIDSLATLQSQTLVYDLDGAGNRYIKLNFDLNPGSGSGDMFAYIPRSLFDFTKTYVYLYSFFGDHNNSNDGFEEWAAVQGKGCIPGSTGCRPPDTRVPEPGTLALLGLGLLGLGLIRRTTT